MVHSYKKGGTPGYAIDEKDVRPSRPQGLVKRRPGNMTQRANVPAEHKGPCCGGTKQWGDGKGHDDGRGNRVFKCHACYKILTMDEKTYEQLVRPF